MIKATMLTLGLVLTLLWTGTSPAEARVDVSTHHISLHTKDGPNRFRGAFFYRWNIRPQPGRDAMWIKPTGSLGGYHTLRLARHPSLECGAMDYYVFTFRVYNLETPYDHSQSFRVDCDNDGRNDDSRGLLHFPRCHMPFIIDSQGRNGEHGHRALCKLRVTVEGVRPGPIPNTHTTLARHNKIHPALYGSN